MSPYGEEIISGPIKSLDFIESVFQFISSKLGDFGEIVWFIFFAVLIFFAVYSLILIYHWFKYGASSFAVWIAMIAYFTVSFALLATFYMSAVNI